MDTQNVIDQILAGAPMNAIISDLIEEHTVRAVKMKRLYEEYKGDVPIKHREYDYNEGEKVDERIPSDYRGYIVDTLTGYLFGNPIAYGLDKEQYGEATGAYDNVSAALKMFARRNSLADLDSETGKKASICGYGARLMYFDTDAKVRIMNINPWEAIFIENPSTGDPEYAMLYYPMEYDDGSSRMHVEWYDRTNWQEFELDGGIFKPLDQPKKHMFDGVPLIEFPNNEERLGDFEKVRESIDAYDILLSDVQSELEEQRLAYMVFSGSQIDRETLVKARQTGAFNLPESTDKVYYLVKAMSDNVIENQKKTLRENIHKFSKTVDMTDESFSGASQSGESRKWKLLAMENLSITKERKFSKALRTQFSIIEKVWKATNIPIIEDTVTWQFKRNLPVEMTHEAEILSKLNGHISNKTRLGLASFIDDAETELNQMIAEQEQFYVPPLEINEDEEEVDTDES